MPQRVTLDVFLYSNLTSLLSATRGSGNNHVEHTSLVPAEIQTSDSLDRSYIEITKKTRRHAVIKRASQSLDQPTAQIAPTKVFTHSPTHDANTFTSPPLYINPISTLNESSVRRPRFIRAPCLGSTDQRRSWDLPASSMAATVQGSVYRLDAMASMQSCPDGSRAHDCSRGASWCQ